MNKKIIRLKAAPIVWRQFTRHTDAIFLSLGKEIRIGVLSAATLLSATASDVFAQTATTEHSRNELGKAEELDEVEVTASRVPQLMQQTARTVGIITREQILSAPAQSINDLLQYAAGVDVRQRGAFGIQTDISINGGTHDQILILLNGVNISSPHTGHLSADLPVAIEDIDHIEVLEGAASRVYGTSAFSGAINIVTRPSQESQLAAGVNGGSYGTLGGDASLTLNTMNMKNQLSGGYQRSDGGTHNSDFEKYRAFYQGNTSNQSFALNWQAGMSGMNYGANTFYSGRFPNQYESNRRFMASVSGKTYGKTRFYPTLYWNRSTDHFQLIRHTNTGENFHLTDVYGASIGMQTDWKLGTTAAGAELRNEGILSTNLGKPLAEDQYVKISGQKNRHYTRKDNRTNLCYFLEHDVLLEDWTFSAGVMANMNTWLDQRFRLYPGIDISYRPSRHWKLFASWNMAQRMPTFTDLYYKSPTNEGNTDLKPEKTQEYTIGGIYRTRGLRVEARTFYRRQKNMIDWVLLPEDSTNNYTTYHATNFKVDNMGAEILASWQLNELLPSQRLMECLSINYTYLHQKRHDKKEIYASSYALDYLRQKLTVRFDM